MKLALTILLTTFLAAAGARAAGGPPPELPIEKAVEIAEGSLASKGVAGTVYIAALAFRRDAIFLPKSVWEVIWSNPISGSRPGSIEVGLEINMSGDVVHLTKGRINVQPVNAH